MREIKPDEIEMLDNKYLLSIGKILDVEKLEYLKELLNTIRMETTPIKDHTDPNAIDDCWEEVFGIIGNIYENPELLESQ